MPEVRALGANCQFEGSLAWYLHSIRPQGLIKGRLSQIEPSRYNDYGKFEAIELLCELDGKSKKWDVNLVEHGRLIPISSVQVEHAILAAQEEYHQKNSTYH